jgi:hypothetical protein
MADAPEHEARGMNCESRYRIKDHFVDATDMIETRQRKQLGKSPTSTKKKSE